MKIILIFWILLETLLTEIVTHCPTHCDCNGIRVECSEIVPDFISKPIAEVKVKDANFYERFNFTGLGWETVSYLSINAGSSCFRDKQKLQQRNASLYQNEFIRLNNLEYLKLTCSCLSLIHDSAFNGLNKLKVLDLSDNGILSLWQITYGINGPRILPNLSELYLSNISFLRVETIKIGTNFYDAVKNKPLKVLDISKNKMVRFDRQGITTAFPCLEKLNVSGDGFVLESMDMQNPGDTSFYRLKVLDLSYPALPMPITDTSIGNWYGMETYAYLPPNLTEVYAKNVVTVPSKIHGISNSTHICFGQSLHHICITGNVKNFRKLVLAENSLVFYDPNLFYIFKHVHYIDLSRNLLGDVLSTGKYLRSCLDILTSVEVFILSENGIPSIPYDAFRSSNSLRVLDLSNNKLRAITFDTDTLVSLEKIDLSRNKITFLDSTSMARLNLLLDNSGVNHTAAARTVLVNLKGNMFHCSCESVIFLHWLTTFKENYTCVLESEKRQLSQSTIQRAQYLCIENTIIAVSVAISLLMLIVLAVIVYLFIRRKRKLQQQRQMQMGLEMYDNQRQIPPVFLSFCSEDERVIMDEIFPQLDDGLKEILKTDSRCVATGSTDFRPGFSVANEIIRCIEASSVVVFFVTNAFCRKMWCRNEVLVANYENKPTVLMLWEEVDVELMPKHLYKHFRLYTRVHWILKAGELEMMPGWKELCENIVRLFGTNAAPI